jgi:5-formyltetrahydrofolate cyclo-ligase
MEPMPSAPDSQIDGEITARSSAMLTAKRDARRDARARRAEAFAFWAARAEDAAARLLAARATAILQATGMVADPTAHIVSGYLPMRTELDPIRLLQALAAAGLTTSLPVVAARETPLLFRKWTPGDPTVPAGFGTREPPPANSRIEPDLLLVPLLAFDRQGYRLGYGGGYYDRTLRALRARPPSPGQAKAVRAIGVAFDEQEIDAVPHLDYDETLDGILTPTGLRSFSR